MHSGHGMCQATGQAHASQSCSKGGDVRHTWIHLDPNKLSTSNKGPWQGETMNEACILVPGQPGIGLDIETLRSWDCVGRLKV